MKENIYPKLELLKKIRLSKKITINEISKTLNITQAYYCQIENGHRRLSYEMAIKLGYIFNLKPDELFYKDMKK